MSNAWHRRLVLSAVVLAASGAPAAAQGGAVVLWDQHIASAMNELLLSDEGCRGGPYAASRQACLGHQLNLSFERHPFYVTTLDQIALFVDRHRDLKVNKEIRPGTELKLNARLTNVYNEEAEVRLKLEIRF